jgi:DNA-binding NarL/FixJ family response regulator
MRAKVRTMAESLKQDMIVKVAIVEDDPETRESCARLLNAPPRVRCVAACGSAEEALRVIPNCRPQVILMDINLPKMSGIACTARLKELLPKTQILMLTAYSRNDYIFDALKAGASGYLLKSLSSEELIRSILQVVEGGAPMSGQIARRVIEIFRKITPKGTAEAQLTSRENEILQLLAQGYSNKEISVHLDCSPGTVKVHLEHIYEKLHVQGRTEAAAKYLGGPTIPPRETAAMRF